jgi:hypothetical protein
VSTLSTLIQYSAWISNHLNKERESKGKETRKEEVKLSLFVDDMILYLKDPKDSTTKLRSMQHFQQNRKT